MKLQIAAAIAAITLAAAPAQAVITSFVLSSGTAFNNGGTAQIIAAPADVAKATLSGNSIFGFNEVTNFTMAAPRPNGFRFATADNGNISNTGRRYSSHFFVFSPNAARTAVGTISFNQNVIAVQRTNTQFASAGTNQLETGATNFAARTDLELADVVARMNAKTVSFNLSATNANGDMFRIVTAVPESPTWAMLIAGFGLVGVARRRRAVVAA
jgi:hypothetical protein